MEQLKAMALKGGTISFVPMPRDPTPLVFSKVTLNEWYGRMTGGEQIKHPASDQIVLLRRGDRIYPPTGVVVGGLRSGNDTRPDPDLVPDLGWPFSLPCLDIGVKDH
jgi:hypothetical protein